MASKTFADWWSEAVISDLGLYETIEALWEEKEQLLEKVSRKGASRMCELANNNPVPFSVKNEAIKKWTRGEQILLDGDLALFRDWWHEEGSHTCSFCSYFNLYSAGCKACPLFTGEICAKPWEEIFKATDRRPFFRSKKRELLQDLVTEMLALIEEVPVLVRPLDANIMVARKSC